jgi:ubiquitin-activating enzyme E1
MSALKRTKSEGSGPSRTGPFFDEDLNSRNLFTYGMDAMSRMAGSSVAVIGLNGVGAEAAKSLILANVGRVTLIDSAIVAMSDLSTHFYLSASDIGQNRALACRSRLQELNPNVEVDVCEYALVCDLFDKLDAVVACDGTMSQHLEWNSMCRARQPQVAFVLVQAYGACFRLFSDFGDEYRSVPGEKPYSYPVTCIAPSNAGCVTVTVSLAEAAEQPAPKKDDVVALSGVPGATDCDGLPVTFCVLTHPKRRAGDSSNIWEFDVEVKSLDISCYSGAAYVTRLVLPVTSTFSTLEHSLQAPGNLSSRAWKLFAFDGRSEQLHVAFAALSRYMQRRGGQLPNARAPSDVAEFLDDCRTAFCSFPDIVALCTSVDEALMLAFVRSSSGLLNAVAAVAGAVAAQEALKRCSMKYVPVSNPQWFYFDAFDVLPDFDSHNETEFAPRNCRYDHQIAVLGHSMQALLAGAKVFVVGAGAVGCEILKNFAMMGVACGDGLVTVTDNDHIEKSNLSRQFLFRAHHIKQSKSVCARESVQQINPDMK